MTVITELDALLAGLLDTPHDPTGWLIVADWLDEHDRTAESELVRLRHELTQAIDVPQRAVKEQRLRALLADGVRPVTVEYVNSIGMRFSLVPPGEFLMGSPESKLGRDNYETPHRVRLTRGFLLGVHQVTQEQWHAIMGSRPSYFKGPTLPVERVSWYDAVEFTARLSGRDGRSYTLPTEAEWEYACRAGTTTLFHFGATISTTQANYDGDYTYGTWKEGEFRAQTTPVGSFPANAWGLFDMHGNVDEWCHDSQDGSDVVCGGSWRDSPKHCRSDCRWRFDTDANLNCVGCRVACRLDEGETS